jgi:tryptophanyl-tRNA synthetase
MTEAKPIRILSGIQPTGILHIGNYFGMMRPSIALQEEGEAFYFIADYHALTSIRDPHVLRQNSNRVALDFLACGLDPNKSALFRQSDVRKVTELTWILSTVTPVSRLELAHSYKDKIARGIAASAGLFSYPVLMAADILIYDSDLVPVGKDQKQHIEITRDIAMRINEIYGSKGHEPILKLPEARIQPATEVVPGLDGQKMSKSYGNTIDIFGEEKEIRKRVMSIVTDSKPVEAPKDATDSTIYGLYSLVATDQEKNEMRQRFEKGGTGYGDFKKELFGRLWEYFAPMRNQREELLADKGYVDQVLAKGAEKANAIADVVMKRVRNAVGL